MKSDHWFKKKTKKKRFLFIVSPTLFSRPRFMLIRATRYPSKSTLPPLSLLLSPFSFSFIYFHSTLFRSCAAKARERGTAAKHGG